MNQKQLNDLPEEILLQVFKEMDYKTLMTSSLVCRNWNQMIKENSAITKKIKLVVDVSPEEIRELPDKFTRKYQSMKIQGNCTKEFDWKLLKQQASHFRNLEIYNFTIRIEDIKNFTNLLASMTKLEMLRIKFSACKIDLTTLNRLKSLDLESVFKDFVFVFPILEFPDSAQLTSLNLSSLEHCDRSKLTSFLAGQKNLEELSIHYCKAILNNIDWKTLQAIQFPLKKLSIREHKRFPSGENLLPFMKKFSNSLEEFAIEYRFFFIQSMYEMILNEFHKLITLKVDVDNAPIEDYFYFRSHPILSVQKLTILGHKPGLNSIKGFILALPNLRTLDLGHSNLSNELMMFIADNLKVLEDLQIQRNSDKIFEGVNIPSLKKIKIEVLDRIKPQDWKQIVRAIPNIEEFEVEWFYDKNTLNEENVKILTEGWTNLKHIKFGDRLNARKSISGKEEILRELKRDGFRFIIKES